MELMSVVLRKGLAVGLCVGVIVVAVLDDVDPVAESIFAGDQSCAAIGEIRGHVEGDVRGCVCKRGCEVAADENCAVRFSILVGFALGFVFVF